MLIETEDIKIVTDPWFVDAAYCDKWYVFPKPVRTDFVAETDAILISHGHEDHLNEATLKLFPKDATVFYPYSFFGGAKEYIESLGFETVEEAVAYRTYKISDKTSVTYLLNSHDSIMVVESGGEVLVNANDALHSYPQKVIDFYVEAINERWKNVDYLFCGFGGASYFPNTMHVAGKDDYEISLVREQLFAHNFCRVVAGLKPKIAVPFAADFALLSENQKWINEARFPRNKMSDYYRQFFKVEGYEPNICDMYSGDVLENKELKPNSPYRRQMRGGSLAHLVEEQYADEIVESQKQEFISDEKAESLIEEIRQNVEKRMVFYDAATLNKLKFTVLVKDIKANNFYNVAFRRGTPQIWRDDKSQKDSILTMKMTSKILRYSIGSDWGADVISVGYGAEIYIAPEKVTDVELESVCMNLLACYPTAFGDLKKSPLRAIKFLLVNPPKYTTSIRKLKHYNNESENYDRQTWLRKNADEIRKSYDLPDLEREFLIGSGK